MSLHPNLSAAIKAGIFVTFYSNGAHIHWPLRSQKAKRGKGRGKTGDASIRAMRRAAFILGNAVKPWGVMATLTLRESVTNPKRKHKSMLQAITREFGASFQWAWFMEFQRRGVIHFHWFFEREEIERRGWLQPEHLQVKKRRAKPTIILRGPFEHFIVLHWCRIVKDSSPQFLAFQRGGICELVRTPDAAGRYLASYATKEGQKKLPEGVDGCGNWWGMSECGRPVPTSHGVVTTFPFDKAYSFVYDKAVLSELVTEIDPLKLWPKMPSVKIAGDELNDPFNTVTQLTFLKDLPLLGE